MKSLIFNTIDFLKWAFGAILFCLTGLALIASIISFFRSDSVIPLWLKVCLPFFELFIIVFTWMLISAYSNEGRMKTPEIGQRIKLAFMSLTISICCYLLSIFYNNIELEQTAGDLTIVSLGCFLIFLLECFPILFSILTKHQLENKIKIKSEYEKLLENENLTIDEKIELMKKRLAYLKKEQIRIK